MATSKKITELDQLTTAANADLLYIVHDPNNIPTSKKITVSDLLKNANTTINTLASAAYTNAVAYANGVATAAYTNAIAYFNEYAGSISLQEKYYDYVNGSLNGSGGLDNQFSGLHEDDDQHEIVLPFPITFQGQTYTSIWIHSNSYIAFGPTSGSPYFPLGPQQMGVPAIMIGATDRELTAYYYGTVGSKFIVRYEGVDKNYGGDGASPSRVWEFHVDSESPDVITILVSGYNIQPSTGIWGTHDGTKWIDIFEPLPFLNQDNDTTYYGVQFTSSSSPVTINQFKFVGTGIDSYVIDNKAFIEIDPLHGILNVDLNDDGDTVLGAGYYGMHLVTAHEGNLRLSPAGNLFANAGSASASQPGDGKDVYIKAGNAYSNGATAYQGGNVYISTGVGSNGGANGNILLATGSNQWAFDKTGVLTLPDTIGDIKRDGVSVLPPTMLTPNIAYTGVFNGYPASLAVTKSQAIYFTENNSVIETTNKYWLATRFDTSDYDLSGTQTLTFNNIGGIQNNFRLGGKSETLLSNVDLKDITVITDHFYLRDLPALTMFSANNLSYVGNYFQIDNMDNADTQFNFPNLKTVQTFYYTWNDILTNTPQFPALETINNSLYIYYNSAAQNTMTFDSLRYFGYGAIYQNVGMFAGPVFTALTSFDYLDMNNNDYMTDPPQFPALQSFTSNFTFAGHDSVTSFPATPSMTTSGYINWYQNAVANGGFDFSSLTRSYNTINISENIAMTTAPAFPALVEVNGALLIENNTSMTGGFDLSALKKLDSNFSAANCSLTEVYVDYILTVLAALDGTNGTTSYDSKVVNLSGGSNAIPSATGLAAIAVLEGRGCTVYYNT